MNASMAALAVALVVFIGWAGVTLWLLGVESSREIGKLRQQMDGAVIVRVCPDGTRILKLKDGSYVDGYSMRRVVDVDKVCG